VACSFPDISGNRLSPVCSINLKAALESSIICYASTTLAGVASLPRVVL
jgi:hypothetical protein